MHASRLAAAALSLLAAAGAAPARAADWPTFRGTERTGVAPDTELLDTWPADGPPLVWKAAGAGRGYASPAVAGDRIYTLGDGLSTAADTDEYLSCFDRQTGAQLWKTKTGGPWTDGKADWQGSRSTPTAAGDTVYVLTPFGQLVACAVGDGREIFRVDLTAAPFAGKKGDAWGYSESVTVDGDRIVCTPGGEQATLVAFDAATGRPQWTCAAPDARGAGHASIVTTTVQRRKVFVQTTASGAFGVDARTGTLLWTYPIEQTTAVIPTPIVKDDLVFIAAGYKRGGALLRQVSGPGGTVRVEEVYPMKPELANKHGGIVLVGDHLYGCADDQPILFCAELRSGRVVWKSRGGGKNSVALAAADGHLYARYANGTLALVAADPAGYREVAAFTVPGSGDRPSWAHPVIVDGRLYLREGDEILCYDVRKK